MPTPHTKQIAMRQIMALQHLIDAIARQGNIDQPTAQRVAAYYIKHRLAKLDPVMGTSMVRHGAFLEPDVIARAVAVA